MNVQAEISLYPLGEPNLLPPIEEFLHILREEGLEPRMGPMSTSVTGESDVLFQAIAKAFERVGAHQRCVLVVKYSNACPPPDAGEQEGDDPGKL